MLVFQATVEKKAVSPAVYNNWFLGENANSKVLGMANYAVMASFVKTGQAKEQKPITSVDGRFEVNIHKETSDKTYTVSILDKVTLKTAYFKMNFEKDKVSRFNVAEKTTTDIGKLTGAFYQASDKMTNADQENLVKIMQVMLGQKTVDGKFGGETLKTYLKENGPLSIAAGGKLSEGAMAYLAFPRQPTAWNSLEYFMDKSKNGIPVAERSDYAAFLLNYGTHADAKTITLPKSKKQYTIKGVDVIKDVSVSKDGVEYTIGDKKYSNTVKEGDSYFYLAVCEFQRQNGIKIDGLVGHRTLEALDKAMGKK